MRGPIRTSDSARKRRPSAYLQNQSRRSASMVRRGTYVWTAKQPILRCDERADRLCRLCIRHNACRENSSFEEDRHTASTVRLRQGYGVTAFTRFASKFAQACPAVVREAGEGWLGRQDSNLGMAVPKTAALPLGDAPTVGGYLAKVSGGRKGVFTKILCNPQVAENRFVG